MHYKKSLWIITIPFIFLACATGKFTRISPTQPVKVSNIIQVPLPKEQAWSRLISGLAGSFFAINNLDKQSGFVNISYTGDPEQFVDGGELIFTVSNLRGNRKYQFPASRAHAQYEEVVSGVLCGIERQLDLDGRVNILVEEIDSTSSKVTVNVRYVLNLKLSGQTVTGDPVTPYQETISFNTGHIGSTVGGTDFRATGKLEQAILVLFDQTQSGQQP
jgi:hypothetical protein